MLRVVLTRSVKRLGFKRGRISYESKTTYLYFYRSSWAFSNFCNFPCLPTIHSNSSAKGPGVTPVPTSTTLVKTADGGVRSQQPTPLPYRNRNDAAQTAQTFIYSTAQSIFGHGAFKRILIYPIRSNIQLDRLQKMATTCLLSENRRPQLQSARKQQVYYNQGYIRRRH